MFMYGMCSSESEPEAAFKFRPRVSSPRWLTRLATCVTEAAQYRRMGRNHCAISPPNPSLLVARTREPRTESTFRSKA
eukprot:768601-Hanusia_phi.AAC.8